MADQFSFEDHDDYVVIASAWQRVKKRLEESVRYTEYTRFLEPLEPVGFEGAEQDVVVLKSDSTFRAGMLKGRYTEMLGDFFSDDLGRKLRVRVHCEQKPRPTAATVERATVHSERPDTEDRFVPKREHRFDNFIEGLSNRYALAGAKCVANRPGTAYNPLFIYGPSGVGKTHLLHAICNHVLAHNKGYILRYVTGQVFLESFVTALRDSKMDAFRRSHRNVSMWLFDDLQLLTGKDKTQEELFHTYNYLMDNKQQVVLSSERSPRDLDMDERLRSRIASGLVVDVAMPDTELRCAIVRAKAAEKDVPMSHDVAMFLAESVPGSVRALEGALTGVIAKASMDGVPIDMDIARVVVEQNYARAMAAKPVSLGPILQAVSQHFSVPVSDIQGRSRRAPIAHARHVALYMARELTHDSLTHIGKAFDGLDHTTVIHAHKKIGQMMAEDASLDATIRSLMRDFRAG